MFWLFEFAKISIQNVRKAMAKFASIRRSSKQNKMFVLYKHFTAFSRSNRRPRIFNQMYRATFSFNYFVPWGSCECFVVENFLRNIYCWGGIVSLPSLWFLFPSLLLPSLQVFPEPKCLQKSCFLFAWIVYLKIQKHFTFLRKFLLHKKRSSYLPTVVGLTRKWYIGYIQNFLLWICWGQNHFH